jgi:hypothetical protein
MASPKVSLKPIYKRLYKLLRDCTEVSSKLDLATLTNLSINLDLLDTLGEDIKALPIHSIPSESYQKYEGASISSHYVVINSTWSISS